MKVNYEFKFVQNILTLQDFLCESKTFAHYCIFYNLLLLYWPELSFKSDFESRPSSECYLVGDQFDIPWSQSHCCISHDLRFDGAQSSCCAGFNKAVQDHIQQVCDLNTKLVPVKTSFSHILCCQYYEDSPGPSCPKSWPGWRDTSASHL